MIKALRISIVIALAILLLGGCTKNKRSMILGSWKLIKLHVEQEEAPHIRFTFHDNLTVHATLIQNGVVISGPVEATYSIKFNRTRYELTISRENRFEIMMSPDYRGTYVIDELSRDVLRLIRIEGLNGAGEWSVGGEAYMMLDLLRE